LVINFEEQDPGQEKLPEQEKLLIVYYNGHGAEDSNDRLIWSAYVYTLHSSLALNADKEIERSCGVYTAIITQVLNGVTFKES